MFKRGDFVMMKKVDQDTLYICQSPTLAYVIIKGGVLENSPFLSIVPDPHYDKVITYVEAMVVLGNNKTPKWVHDILTDDGNPIKKKDSNILAGYQPTDTVTVRSGAKLYNPPPIPAPKPDMTMTLNTFQETCRHAWREYIGLRHSFMYCKHCDKKKSF